MIADYLRALRWLITVSPWGTIAACLPLEVLLSLGLIPYAWRRGGPIVPTPVRVAMGLFCIGELAAFALGQSSRARFAGVASGAVPDLGQYVSQTYIESITMQLTQVAAASAAVFAIPLFMTIILARAPRRWESPQPGMGEALIAMASMGWAAAVATWHLDKSPHVPLEQSPAEAYETFVASFGVVDVARARQLVLGVALLASIVVLRSVIRQRSQGSSRSAPPYREPGVVFPERAKGLRLLVPALGVALFALGASTFAATRDEAFDARHPMPYRECGCLGAEGHQASHTDTGASPRETRTLGLVTRTPCRCESR